MEVDITDLGYTKCSNMLFILVLLGKVMGKGGGFVYLFENEDVIMSCKNYEKAATAKNWICLAISC